MPVSKSRAHSLFFRHAIVVLSFVAAAACRGAPIYELVTLGLYDIEHTNDEGAQSSDARILNAGGHILGRSRRYSGGRQSQGETAWLFNKTSTVKLGWYDEEHTRQDGYKNSVASALNDTGQVIGYSERYSGGSEDLGRTAWLFNGQTTIDVGRCDEEHTDLYGAQFSSATNLNEAGHAIGYSRRYQGGTTSSGITAWIYNGAAIVDLGFYDREHTRGDGFLRNTARGINNAGQVWGDSDRYQGGDVSLGQSAWFYDGQATLGIGLYDVEHTRADGLRLSSGTALSESGHVIGSSFRFDGGAQSLGETAWIFKDNTTIRVGLYDSAHTNLHGRQYSEAQLLNEAGQVAGYSLQRGSGGRSAWLYDGEKTIRLGRFDAEHTKGGGVVQFSEVDFLNQAGQAVGSSKRFNSGSDSLGSTAWIYDGSSTVDIGFYDSKHTGFNGRQFSYAVQLNEAGQVIGNSTQSVQGATAWWYDGHTTIAVGHYDAEHTRQDGMQDSRAYEMNEAGQVRGHSERYHGGTLDLGLSAWVHSGEKTMRIGLHDERYTRADGYQFSWTEDLNEQGQVVGFSTRYAGGIGDTAWLYDQTTDRTIPFDFASNSDEYTNSEIDYFSEDGTVIGHYTLNSTLGGLPKRGSFYFHMDHGLHDLASLVNGGLVANGWASLMRPTQSNLDGSIIGYGTSYSQSRAAFLLKPIPEPGSFVSLALGCLVCWVGRSTLRGRRMRSHTVDSARAVVNFRR